MDIKLNNVIICVGEYLVTSTQLTLQFPITYTHAPRMVSTASYSNTNQQYPYTSRFPYNITTTGFSRAKTTEGVTIYWLSIGY